METVCIESGHGQLNPVDRLSDLPDFILHHIISFLDRLEARRASKLSKRWAHISATNPVLLFDFYYCNYQQNFLEYVTSNMKRYSKENLRILELTLKFPPDDDAHSEVDYFTKAKVDEFLEIAVRNQVEKLVLLRPSNYQLPVSLFSAKSLKYLFCLDVKIPYCNTINLMSLETLILWSMAVEDRLLNHILSSCRSLKTLEFSYCSGIKSIVIPHCSQLERLKLFLTDATVILETSSLKYFEFFIIVSWRGSNCHHESWPVISQTGLLINLVTLELTNSSITDEVFDKLLSELISLETLKLCQCNLLTTIKSSRDQLKTIDLDHCKNLVCVWIDAPGLRKYNYSGEYEAAMSFDIKSQANCDVSLYLPSHNLDTEVFLILKKLLIGLSNCNVLDFVTWDYKLVPDLSSEYKCDDIEVDENRGCDVKEFKLSQRCFGSLSISNALAILGWLFWACHPNIVSVRIDFGDMTIKDFVCELEDMAKHKKYPLKRVEVIGDNCSDVLEWKKLGVQLRLSW